MKKVIWIISIVIVAPVLIQNEVQSENAEEASEFDEPKDVLGENHKDQDDSGQLECSQPSEIIRITVDSNGEFVGLVSTRKSPVGELNVHFSNEGEALAFTLAKYENSLGGTTSLYSYLDSKEVGYATASGLHDLDGKQACGYVKPSLLGKQVCLPEKASLTAIPVLPKVPKLGLISMQASDLSCKELLGIDSADAMD